MNVDKVLEGLSRRQIIEYQALAVIDGWFFDERLMLEKIKEAQLLGSEEFERLAQQQYG